VEKTSDCISVNSAFEVGLREPAASKLFYDLRCFETVLIQHSIEFGVLADVFEFFSGADVIRKLATQETF
jgi:hypothetical protein